MLMQASVEIFILFLADLTACRLMPQTKAKEH